MEELIKKELDELVETIKRTLKEHGTSDELINHDVQTFTLGFLHGLNAASSLSRTVTNTLVSFVNGAFTDEDCSIHCGEIDNDETEIS